MGVEMSLTKEWHRRIDHWRRELKEHLYTPLESIPFQGFVTKQHLTLAEAQQHPLELMPIGKKWGAKWEYGWFHGTVIIPDSANGQRIVLKANPGGEGLVYLNGEPAQSCDWAHTELTLSKDARPGEKFDIWIETYAGHGPLLVGEGPVAYGKISVPEPGSSQVEVGDSTIGIWHEEIFQLGLDVETLYQIRGYLDPNSLRVAEIDEALRQFTLLVDFEVPFDDMVNTVQKARKILEGILACQNGSTSPELYMIGHAHLDVAWLWPLAETERKIGRTIANQLSLMAEYPEYKYIQSQPHLFTMLECRYPDLSQHAKNMVKSGQLIPDGGMWVEADTNLTSGESLIRQFMYGKQFFKNEFGVDSELLWLPDVFGYSGSLPQIMRGCGVKYFATQKIFWTYNGGDTFPYNLFTWEGIDGSEVLAHIFNDYNSETNPECLNQRWSERVQKDGISSMVVAFGWGDGGGGPTRHHLEFLRRSKNLEGVPRTRMSSPVEFFKDVEKKGIPNVRYVGELYFQAHRGTYTSQARTKNNNRRAEFNLREVELWSAAAHAMSGYQYPYSELDEAWKTVLLLHFHDIIPGSSIQRVYEEAENSHVKILQTTDSLADQARKRFSVPGIGLTIFNSLSWERESLIQLPTGFSGAKDSNGQTLPVQISGNETLVKVTLPSCGWTTLIPTKEKPILHVHTFGVNSTESLLENDLLRIVVNDLGEITSVFDKETQREWAADTCNKFKLYKDVPNWFDAWDIDSMYELTPVNLSQEADVKIDMNGPLVASLRVTRMINHSRLEQQILLKDHSREIVFKTDIDWQESHKLLKVSFPVSIHSNEAIHEIQFGHIRRPNHRSRPFDASRFEVSNHKWTALVEEARGAAVLNDSKYGVNVLSNSINLTLLKSALAPDMQADRGKQSFTYAFFVWNGNFSDSDVVRKAFELNCPVHMVTGNSSSVSLFTIDNTNVIIDTVKAAEDQTGDIIVRLYESKHTTTRCKLSTCLPVHHAEQTDMLEQFQHNLVVVNNQLELDFRPFEVKTVRLKLN
jgi:alpha-mannosidase